MRKIVVAVVWTMCLGVVGHASAEPVGVTVLVGYSGSNLFNPSVVYTDVYAGDPDDIVTWDWAQAAAAHNVRQKVKLFRSGSPTANTSTTFSRKLSAGRFPYECEVHGPSMSGEVFVAPAIVDISDPTEAKVRWASSDTNSGKAFDVDFRVNSGVWRHWKTDTTSFTGVFGKNNNPINVKPGTYEFRARSQKRTDTPKRHSGWSGIVSYAFS